MSWFYTQNHFAGAHRRLVSGEGEFVVDIDFQRGGVVHEKIAVPKPAPASL